jgi:hypothetical protein
MVKPEELRIGNLVTWPDEKDCNAVPWSRGHWIGVHKGNYPMPEPIPLTPEWLEKAGLPYAQNACWIYGSMRIYNVTIDDSKPAFRITLAGNELVVLNFVHELQNFNYIFTGQELTFN